MVYRSLLENVGQCIDIEGRMGRNGRFMLRMSKMDRSEVCLVEALVSIRPVRMCHNKLKVVGTEDGLAPFFFRTMTFKLHEYFPAAKAARSRWAAVRDPRSGNPL